MEIGAVSNVVAANLQRVTVDTTSAGINNVNAVSSQTATQMTSAVQQVATPPSMEQLKQAVDEINKSMDSLSRGLQFAIDEESHRPIVKVIDHQTQKIIRQIPSEEALALARSLDQLIGKLIDKKA